MQRFVGLCWLAMLAAGCVTSQQQSGGRERVNDPQNYRPGLFFSVYVKSSSPHDSRQAEAERLVFGGSEGLNRMEEALRRLDDDQLARVIVTSFESVLSTAITAGVVQQLYEGDHKGHIETLKRADNVVYLPDGSRRKMSLAAAPHFHIVTMRLAGRALETRSGWNDMAGPYALIARGDCPIESGPVTIDQAGFLLEVRRDSDLLLFGTVTSKGVWFVANEQRYGVIEKLPGGAFKWDVPDRPSELFRSTTTGSEMKLAALVHKRCELELRRGT